MFNLIKSFGRLIVRMYNAEARKLSTKARAEAKLARELSERAHKLSESSVATIDKAAKVSAQAQQLSKFFE